MVSGYEQVLLLRRPRFYSQHLTPGSSQLLYLQGNPTVASVGTCTHAQTIKTSQCLQATKYNLKNKNYYIEQQIKLSNLQGT